MPGSKLDARDVRVDPLLTSVSIAYRNTAYIAEQIAPLITSPVDAGKYAVYNQADWFRNEAAKRAAGTRAKRGDFGITFDSFLCEEVAFAREIPDEIRRNAMDPIRPDQDATDYATDKVLLAKEVRVAAKMMLTGSWASGHAVTLTGGQQWSDYSTSDPISDIEVGVNLVAGKTGRRPNTMVMSFPTYQKLKNHPDIVDRIKYSQKGIVTIDLLKELFEVERIFVGSAILTASNEGVAAGSEVYSYVWGKGVWVGYVAPNPGLQTPSAMYQFSSGPRNVRRWREEPEHQDVVEAYELVDERIVSSLVGYLLNTAIA